MKITGIICEYNPLHLGHKKQLDMIRGTYGADTGIVCLMSGSYVQRGAPAILDKMRRAEAAVRCGADLVLELPVTVSLASAEGFASGGVRILAPFCHELCFGAETADRNMLLSTAEALLSPAFSAALRNYLDRGFSFPAARQAAVDDMGLDGSILSRPNDILAVEYCKAILCQNASMLPMPIRRDGRYHDTAADPKNPSATAVRSLMTNGNQWFDFVPQEIRTCFEGAALHTLTAGERALLARLRCMTEADFAALPYGTEGLWRKFMHAVREETTVEAILTRVKSKRYTRTRLDRMLMCAFLGITQEMLDTPIPYVRVLAFNDRGREILKKARSVGSLPNIGELQANPYQDLENRCSDLYGLFAVDALEPPGTESKRRVFYHRP